MMAPMPASLIAPMASSLIQHVASSSSINAISGKRVMKAGKSQESGFLTLLALTLMIKVLEKENTREGRGYNNMGNLDKNL